MKQIVEIIVTLSMKTLHSIKTGLVALIGFAAATGLFAQDPPKNTEVLFFEPENFTDVADSWGSDYGRDGNLSEFRQYIEQRAERLLPPGTKLSVTITDIDLAGDFEPWHGFRFSDVRIVKDLYPPRMNLQFQLTDANGVVIKEGARKLRDMAFLMTSSFSHDPLRHDKELLDDWLRTEFRHRT